MKDSMRTVRSLCPNTRDWSRYQDYEFSQVDDGTETAEWVDYVTRLWQILTAPIDTVGNEMDTTANEATTCNQSITGSVNSISQTSAGSLKRGRENDGGILTSAESAKRKLIQSNLEKQDREKRK